MSIENIFENIVGAWNSLAAIVDSFLKTPAIIWLRVLAGLASLVFIAVIVYIFAKGDIIKDKLLKIKIFFFQSNLEDREFILAWKKIIRLAKKGGQDSYRKALQTADFLAVDVLADLGILGVSLKDKLKNNKDYSISNAKELAATSQFVKEISDDENIGVSRKETIKHLLVYEKMLKEVGIL